MNPAAPPADYISARATFVGSRALPTTSRTRIAVVGHGNTPDVGSKTLVGESGQKGDSAVTGGFAEAGLEPPPPLKKTKKWGAMSEQSADSGRGNEQVPQQLVHLVGYREPTVPLPWIRPRRA